MEEIRILNKESVRKVGIQFGLAAGLVSIAYFFMLYFSGAYLFDPFYKFDFWVSIPFLIFMMIIYRQSADKVTMIQGLVGGLYLVVVYASIVAIFYYVFLSFFDVDFIKNSEIQRMDLFQNLLSKAVQEDNKALISQLTKQLEEVRKIVDKGNKPLDIAMDRILTSYVIGGVFTLFVAILFRKTLK